MNHQGSPYMPYKFTSRPIYGPCGIWGPLISYTSDYSCEWQTQSSSGKKAGKEDDKCLLQRAKGTRILRFHPGERRDMDPCMLGHWGCPEPRSTFPPRYQLFSLTELVMNMVFLRGNNEILDVTSRTNECVPPTRERKAILE